MEGAFLSLCGLITQTSYSAACYNASAAAIIHMDYKKTFQGFDRLGEHTFKDTFTKDEQVALIGIGAAVLIADKRNLSFGVKNVLYSDVVSVTVGRDWLIKLTWGL